MGTRKKRGCGKYVVTLILGALIVIGAWYSWENFLKEMPIVQSIVQLINPDAVIESSSSAPSSASSSSSSNSSSSNTSSSNSNSSDSETIIEKILPKTDPYADAYEMGEWVKQDNVWVRLYDYNVSRGTIQLNFEIWNKTGKDIYFSWTPSQNFSMTDNKNNRYETIMTTTGEQSVENDERLNFTYDSFDTIRYMDDPLYESGVTDLYITMEYISKIDKAVFHISVGN